MDVSHGRKFDTSLTPTQLDLFIRSRLTRSEKTQIKKN